MCSIKINQDYISTVRNATADDKLSLPFKAPSFWWKNGEANRPADRSGAEHFGGWACNSEDFTASIPPGDIPAKFVSEEWINNQGTHYSVYATRYLSVAVFASRSKWLSAEETKTDKGYGSTQWIAFAALYDKDKKIYVPWSPVVLTATSTKAMLIKNALVKFDKLTASLRATYADSAPIGFFWANLGTFGERNTVPVGKGNNVSQVTPCTLRAPAEMTTEEQLVSLYVGDEVAETISKLATLAKDWLEEWKFAKSDKPRSLRPGDKGYGQDDVTVPEMQLEDIPPM